MRFKIRNAFIGIAIYFFAIAFFSASHVMLAVLFMGYALLCMILTKWILTSAEARQAKHEIEFSRDDATVSLGEQWGSFHYVFFSDQQVIAKLQEKLGSALKLKLRCSSLEGVTIKDIDREICSPESRIFLKASADQTLRKTSFNFVCTFTRTGNVQGVRWWLYIIGQRDPNKVFWKYVFSPLSIPVTIIPYIRRQYEPLSGLNTIYPGFFNAIDILNKTREIQFVAFETLVETLDSFGIDTSDLKQQKSNMLNINVSGGEANFGSIVQNAVGKIGNVIGAGKRE